MSVIPCIRWVKRGKSKSKPEKIQIEQEDLRRIIEETKEKIEEDEEASSEEEDETKVSGDSGGARPKAAPLASEVDIALAMANQLRNQNPKNQKKVQQKSKSSDGHEDDFESRYNMDDYDEEENDASNPLKGIGNLSVFASNTDDPYVDIKDYESDEEDFEIKNSDNLLLVAKAESDCCSLEVHVYNSELGDLFCHHDILLSSFPLAVEWMDYDLRDGSTGSYVAIATMDPTIDIWDLDLVDSLEPLATLGQKHKKKKKKIDIPSHTDAVLDLSWNPLARHVLASASADFTVGLWDLTEGKLSMHLKHHKEKVQCVEWHPAEEHMLLSGSFDKTVKMYDCRSPDANHKTWTLNGEIEKILWNPHSPLNFFASTDKGHVFYMDSRQDEPIYTLAAHTESVTGLNLSSEDARILVTTSSDHTVKVWDIENNKPSLVHSQNLKMGQMLCLDNCPDASFVFAMGGEKRFKVWDMRDIKNVFKHFCGREEDYIPDSNPEQEEDVEAAMEMEEMDVAMDDAEPSNQDAAISKPTNQSTGHKKKKKKKKPKKH